MSFGFGFGYTNNFRLREGVVDVTAPNINSTDTISITENTVLNHSLTSDEFVTWSIVGGVDIDDFELSSSTLRWVGNSTKDYENPDDSNTNNVYTVVVRATDPTGNFTNQTITVTVTNSVELGNELVLGDFTDNTGWTLEDFNTGLNPPVMSGGTLTFNDPAADGQWAYAAATDTLVEGTMYRVTGSATITDGGIKVSLGGTIVGNSTPNITSSGEFTYDVTIDTLSNQNIYIATLNGSTIVVLTDLSVKEILA